MMRPASGAMTINSPSGAGVTIPVAWRTARSDPILASSTLTGTGASLSVSSALCLLHAAVTIAAARIADTNHGDTKVTERKKFLHGSVARDRVSQRRGTFMAAELLSRARDPQGPSGIDRLRRAIAT